MLWNVCYGILSENLAWADEDDRKLFHEQMEWPDVLGEESQAEQDRGARQAAATLGGPMDVDAAVMRLWEARRAKEEAERTATEAAGTATA
jgi:hypothetical protein